MFVVTAAELRKLVPMPDAITAVADAFASVVDGTGDQPRRVAFSDGTALAMMGRRISSGPTDAGTAFKVVSVGQANPRLGLPAISALVVWFDGATRRPQLLVEGSSLTALRTGAASGVATQLLASRTASTLAMIGAGGQAADQVRSVCAVRDIATVRIFAPSGVSGERLATRLAPELPETEILLARSANEAVDGADVICCATNAADPVIAAETVGERVHVNALGSYRPDMREVPTKLLARAEIVAVDEREAAFAESGEIIAAVAAGALPESAIVEIGELVLDPPKAPTGLTVFKSVGIAMQDWAICRLLSERVPPDARTIDLWDETGAPSR